MRGTTRRQLIAAYSRDGLCTKTAEVGVNHVFPELYFHQCDLSARHFGVHLCWCGSAFNDALEVFTQRTLPGV